MRILLVSLFVIAGACGSKGGALPSGEPTVPNELELFERRFVRESRALVAAARERGQDVGPVHESYPGVFVGKTGIYVNRKLVARHAEVTAKRAELRAAFDANAKLVTGLGWAKPTVVFDLDKEPAATAIAVLRLCAERDVAFDLVVEDAEFPDRATRQLDIGQIHTEALVEADRIELSVLVDKASIWVGLSRVNEFQEIPNLAAERDFEKLAMTLKLHKQSTFFAERSELELAFKEATSLEVLAVTSLAGQVGFRHIALLDHAQLSAKPQL